MSELWSSILYVLVLPILVQVWKVIADRLGREPPRAWLQLVILLLSAVVVWLQGGFAGVISVGSPPAWSGDLVGYIDGWAALLAQALGALYLAWRAVTGIYDGLWRDVMERRGFATRSALARRAERGVA